MLPPLRLSFGTYYVLIMAERSAYSQPSETPSLLTLIMDLEKYITLEILLYIH